METLQGLDVLTHIGWSLAIIGNGSFAALDGLDALTEMRHSVEIRNNPALSEADVSLLSEQLVERGFVGDLLSGGNGAP